LHLPNMTVNRNGAYGTHAPNLANLVNGGRVCARVGRVEVNNNAPPE
jgi:hypothetical protein